MQPELRPSLYPQTAKLRGSDYQHLIGRLWGKTLKAPNRITSVICEDSAVGAFDDVVARRPRAAGLCSQAGSYNHSNDPFNNDGLLKAGNLTSLSLDRRQEVPR